MATPSLLAKARPRLPRHMMAPETCIFHSLRRSMATKMRPAPSTRSKQRLAQPYVPGAEELARRAKWKGERDEAKKHFDAAVVTDSDKANVLQLPISIARQFNRNQTDFLFLWISPKQERNYKPDFDVCMSSSSVSLDEVYKATLVLRRTRNAEMARVGRGLIMECARRRHDEATIQVVASAVRKAQAQKGQGLNPLQSREVMLVMGHLRDLGREGNARAMVVEAHVARHQGEARKAVGLYQQAIERMANNEADEVKDESESPLDDLSSPWVQLAFLQGRLGDIKGSVKTLAYGTSRDDPEAFFNLARLDYRMSGDKYSEEWVYNMTKAASSGHIIAAHLLGEYYANSPPPPPQPSHSFMDQLKGFGYSLLGRTSPSTDPKDNIHHHIAFASSLDPAVRIKLAFEWLETASKALYLPATLDKALIQLQAHIYSAENLLRPLDPLGEQVGPGAVKNPLYNPAQVRSLLMTVFHASEQVAMLKTKTPQDLARAIPKISRFPEIWDTVRDDKKVDEICARAREIADAVGMDVWVTAQMASIAKEQGQYLEEGKVYHMHSGSGVPRGQGLLEYVNTSSEPSDDGVLSADTDSSTGKHTEKTKAGR